MRRSRQLIKDNPREAFRILLGQLGYPYSNELYDAMSEHPSFPSFFSYNYILKRVGIDNAALHISYDELMVKMPMPAMVHVTTNVELFLVVGKADEKGVYIINERGGSDFITREEFLKMWDGNTLIFDTDNIPKAPKQSSKQKAQQFLKVLHKPFLIISAAFFLLFLLRLTGHRSWLNWIFLSITGIGVAVSILLLVAQFDKYNTFVKKLCTSKKEGSKRDCSSILDSKDAYFIGLFSWSEIGFVYYVSLFIILLLLPVEGLNFAMLLSLLAFGYVFYSIFYQKFIARSWCTLCLAVQVIFTTLFLISLFLVKRVELHALLQPWIAMIIAAVGIGVTAIYVALKPLVQAKVEHRMLKHSYKWLKHEDGVFGIVSNEQMTILTDTVRLVRVGSPSATSCITMAFGPMCQPCMRELQELIPILKVKRDTAFELAFVLDKDNDEAKNIALWLLDVYLNRPNDFLDELEKYVINYPKSRYKKNSLLSDSALLDEILSEHDSWRKAYRIYSTPVVFLNHRKLPHIYTTQDLDFICS